MGRIFVVDLEGRTYKCKFCKTHLSLADDLVSRVFEMRIPRKQPDSPGLTCEIPLGALWSKHVFRSSTLGKKGFHCRRGKAYLFNKVVNVTIGPQEERAMLSGIHTVADIFCCCCGQIVGWKYEAAYDESQKYKEGKFVLERDRIVDGVDTEFYIDTRPSTSDAEDA